MRRPVLCALFAIACCVFAVFTAKASDRSAHELIASTGAIDPSPFTGCGQTAAYTRNDGQWPGEVLFRADGLGATMWFTRTGILYEFLEPDVAPIDGAAENVASDAGEARVVRLLAMEFVGADPAVQLEGHSALAWRSNYFYGDNPAGWRTDVPGFEQVVYRNLYPGVDLICAGGPGTPKLSLRGAEDAAEPTVRVRFVNSSGLVLGQEGQIATASCSSRVVAMLGTGISMKELADGSRVLKAAAAREIAAPAAGAAGLPYSSLIGGGLDDRARAIKVDAGGNAFVVGYTSSTNFPTKTPYQTDQASNDAFVLKLATGGNTLVYATYLGGGSGDVAVGVAINGSGQAYVTGSTSSANFPTLNPYQTQQGADDIFVVKLAAAGNSLLYGTYVGGSGLDNPTGIAVDDSGRAFVVGTTASTNFPTVGAFQTDQGASDAFVFKLSAAGNALVYATYLGGSGADAGVAIALNNAGNAFVTGTTSSTNFPTAGPYQTDKAGDDVFVVKMNTAGSALVYGTYLGGSGADEAGGIAVNASGSAFVTGSTKSADFPTLNPYQFYQGDADFWDGFVVKLNTSGNNLAYGTYLAGTLDDRSRAIDVDDSGNAYVAGATWSHDFPLVNEDGTDMDTTDAFVAKLGSTGSLLAYSSYLGGTYRDEAMAITANDSGACYVAGFTLSPDFPMQNSYQSYLAGQEAFVTKVFTGACPITLTGDVNASGTISSADIISLVNFVFKGSAHPKPCDAAGDVNCSGSVSSADIIFLVNHVFKGAAAPCDACGSSLAGGC